MKYILYAILGWMLICAVGDLLYFITGVEKFLLPLAWTFYFIFNKCGGLR